MKQKLPKTKLILIIVVFILGIIFIILGFTLNSSNKNSNSTKPNQELLGEERLDMEEEIINIIEKYLNNEAIKTYLEKKGNKRISMEEIKEELKIDISEFEQSKYGCNNAFTIIDFNDDYSDHTISLTCDILLKK